MRQFLINQSIVSVSQEKIQDYYPLGDECFIKVGNSLHRYYGNLYISRSGRVIDEKQAEAYIPSEVYDEDGNLMQDHVEFFGLDSTQAFIYYNQLFIIDNLEELCVPSLN